MERANRETGGRAVYAQNLSGGGRKLARQVALCRSMGVGAVMFCPLLVGPSAMVDCVDDGLDMPLLSHPALAGCGRITRARVEELVTFYGDDVMLLIGGALLAAHDG